MGCGKTTTGRLLAKQLGWRFVDIDENIEKQAGLGISQIFDRLGEAAFRDLERAELARALGEASASVVPTVLALGGGTFAQPANWRCFAQPAVQRAGRALVARCGSTVRWNCYSPAA